MKILLKVFVLLLPVTDLKLRRAPSITSARRQLMTLSMNTSLSLMRLTEEKLGADCSKIFVIDESERQLSLSDDRIKDVMKDKNHLCLL